jgi:methionine sulfoxide reductase heme-binding subunit
MTGQPVTKPNAPALKSWTLPPEWIKVAIYVFGMTPATFAFYYAFTGQLGAEPIKALTQALGEVGFRFLLIGLAITPLRKLGGPNFVRYRRAIGLVAFFNAFLHVMVYVWFDHDFNIAAILKDIWKRPYITVGMVAFVIVTALAITSHNTMIKRMGAIAWQRLHKLVYVAVAAVCLHYILLVKAWPVDLFAYATLTVALLGYRVYDHYAKPAKKRVPTT